MHIYKKFIFEPIGKSMLIYHVIPSKYFGFCLPRCSQKFINIFKNVSVIKTVFTAESSRHAVSSLNLDMLYRTPHTLIT